MRLAAVITREEAVERLERAGTAPAERLAEWVAADWFEGASVRWFGGDAELDGLEVDDEIVIVCGDLRAAGPVVQGRSSLLGVLGGARAAHFLTFSLALIEGDLEVEGLIYGNSSNAYWLSVGGDVRARAVVECGHRCGASGRIDVAHAVRTANVITSLDDPTFHPGAALHEVFDGGLLRRGEVDEAALLEAVRGRGALFRLGRASAL